MGTGDIELIHREREDYIGYKTCKGVNYKNPNHDHRHRNISPYMSAHCNIHNYISITFTLLKCGEINTKQ